MVERCNNNVGVKIYVDAVINHMCGADAGDGAYLLQRIKVGIRLLCTIRIVSYQAESKALNCCGRFNGS